MTFFGLPRDHWQRKTAALDPEVDFEEISRILGQYEFPWDTQQALSLALFRTYAVPSIGRLLYDTGQFTEDTQRRHDDTALILDVIAAEGLESADGRAGVRRMNQMHGSYEISNADMVYVLSTFVVTTARWVERYGWRQGTPGEQLASVRYYQRLGALMGIKEIPATYDEFAGYMDDYEARYFAFDAGARAVADATLDLLVSFYPRIARPVVRAFSLSLMEPHLLAAFDYRRPAAPVVWGSRSALRMRARFERLLPARRTPKRAQDLPRVRSYPQGFNVENLGTFPSGCPVGAKRAPVA